VTAVRTTIGGAIRWWAHAEPGAVAVRCGGQVLTRADLDARSDALARRWVADGLRVDDVVTVELPNGLDAVVAHVAAWKAGATPQPLSPETAPADRTAVLELTRPAVVVSEPLGTVEDPGGAPPDRAASSWKAPTSSGSTGRPKVVRAAASAHVDPRGPVAPFVPRRAVQLVAGPLSHAGTNSSCCPVSTPASGCVRSPSTASPGAWSSRR
jgi:bile acid-coenzyme A ligase